MGINKLIVLSFLVVSVLVFAGCDDSGSGSGSEKTYSLGEIGPSGVGIVFYVTDGGRHGMEYAPARWNGWDQDSGSAWRQASAIISTTRDGIGEGYYNSYNVLNSTIFIAAYGCTSYSGGAKEDWFMASKAELIELQKYKNQYGGTGFREGVYWSSTADTTASSPSAYTVNLTSGSVETGSDVQTAVHYYRPVRSF